MNQNKISRLKRRIDQVFRGSRPDRRAITPESIIVYQVTGPEHLVSGAEILKSLAERVFPGMRRVFIVVDQLRTEQSVGKNRLAGEECFMLAGDNSLREFTAYDRGIRFIDQFSGSTVPDYNPLVIVANETFHRHYGDAYLKAFTYEKARTVIEDDHFMGYVDAYPDMVQVLGYRFRGWIRSSIYIGQYRSMLDVFPFSIDVGDDIFSDDLNRFFSDTSKLSENYKDLLRHWLLEAEIDHDDFPQIWHSAEEPGLESIDKLRLKAKSIVCEQLFTARAKRLGYGITVTN